MTKNQKKMRKNLINLQNQLGKNEGKTIWLQLKKESANGTSS